MQDACVLELADPDATDRSVGGGKASSLAKLVQAGFPVPAGFVVTSAAYAQAISDTDAQEQIRKVLADVDFNDAGAVEDAAQQLRAVVAGAPMPTAISDAIVAAYRSLGTGAYVAVRSSGTAEDLAEASFAGQHDTYLDIRGEEAVLDAVRRCWASLWTARACAYRQEKGFDHDEVRLAVVVQAMVSSDVSGVMFTANPLTTSVDEFVVNASWGLGEGVVSGMLTPDLFALDRATLQVRSRELGTKEIRIDRDAARGSGIRHEDVPAADRERFCLSDTQLAELGDLGRRVMDFYDGWPQDLEWAFADGQLFLLQSRDVTGVDFSWDEDLDLYTSLPRIPADAVVTRAFADEVGAGRTTPLFYSARYDLFNETVARANEFLGLPRARFVQYYKGKLYWNCEESFRWMAELQPKMLRSEPLLLWAPPSWYARLADDPGPSWPDIARMVAGIPLINPNAGPYQVFEYCDEHMATRGEEMLGLPPEALQGLSDDGLVQYFEEVRARQLDFYQYLWISVVHYCTWALSGLTWMVQNWYTGSNPMIFADLITGLPRATDVMHENRALWDLAQRIRTSTTLSELFESTRDGEFFAACENSEDGRAFLEEYRDFLASYGHRGHAERDAWYPRRAEDPSIDYLNFQLLLRGAEDVVPGAAEERVIARREAAAAEFIECIRQQPDPGPKVDLFVALQDLALKCYMLRDNERFHSDRGTFAKKRALVEIGRRVFERGLLPNEDDFWYLGKDELIRLLTGDTTGMRVVRAKIEARRRNCDRIDDGAWEGPMYIRGNGAAAPDIEVAAGEQQEEDGVLRGVGTSGGCVVGTARIVPTQKDIGKVQKGEILVCHATDPGWTSVFMVAKAAIFETGGLLAHCSCISREYGIPAVQIVGATKLIEDGATIEVNGDTGQVRVLAPAGTSA